MNLPNLITAFVEAKNAHDNGAFVHLLDMGSSICCQ